MCVRHGFCRKKGIIIMLKYLKWRLLSLVKMSTIHECARICNCWTQDVSPFPVHPATEAYSTSHLCMSNILLASFHVKLEHSTAGTRRKHIFDYRISVSLHTCRPTIMYHCNVNIYKHRPTRILAKNLMIIQI